MPTPSHLRRPLPAAAATLALIASPVPSAATPPQYALTIYSASDAGALFAGPVDYEPPPGYALVRERRTASIGAGPGTLTLNGFPRYLDPNSLTASLERGRVSNQRFDAEPLRSESILERSIGRQIIVEQTSGRQTSALAGELLSAGLPLALRLEDGSIVSVNDYSRIRFPSPAPGISAVPQLRLGVDADRAGEQTISLSYPAAGLAWRAEYVAQLRQGRDCRLDFAAFAQIVNRSGQSFPAARVRLVAGEPPRPFSYDGVPYETSTPDAGAGDDTGPDQYRLDGTIDVPDDSSQQVALLPERRNLRCSERLLYVGQPLRAQPQRVPITEPGFGRGGERKVRSTLSFGIDGKLPIPAGRVRVLAEDEHDGTLELKVEQMVPRTPADQPVDIAIAEATELKASRNVSEFKVDESGRGVAETITVRLHNSGNADRSVTVREHLYRWTRWQIVDSSIPFEQRDADAIEFRVDVPAKSDASLSYRVHYRWTEHLR